jgi:hypothetical protein
MNWEVEQVDGAIRYSLPPRATISQRITTSLILVLWAGLAPVLAPRFGRFEWVFFGAAWLGTLYGWLMQVFGKELLASSGRTLTIKRRVVGFEPAHEYHAAEIRDLRVMPDPVRRGRGGLTPFEQGRIGFDYRGKTVRFAAGLDATEASALIEELKRRWGL